MKYTYKATRADRFQAGNLISCLTVFENIALPLYLNHYGKKELNRRVNRLLEALSLEGLSRTMPRIRLPLTMTLPDA